MMIRKSDGTEQRFDEQKLARALERARVPAASTQTIVSHIGNLVRPGTTTQEIHARVLHQLESQDALAAARYNLKHAMFALGPTGFPFETFFANVMTAYGWKTQTGVFIAGQCVKHEIDVYGERDEERRAIEVKYHNTAGGRSDVKVALYVHARHLDLHARDPQLIGALVTNTQFTTDAIAYGECVGMKMKSWNYPENKGLSVYIEDKRLYPLTVFNDIPASSRALFLKDERVMASDLCDLPASAAAHYHLPPAQFASLQERARILCLEHQDSSVS